MTTEKIQSPADRFRATLEPRMVFFGLSFIVALALAFAPLSGTLGPSAAIVLVSLALWSTGLLPPFVTSLLFFATVLIPGLVTPELMLAGFGSTAVWLIISGFVIGAAITGSKRVR